MKTTTVNDTKKVVKLKTDAIEKIVKSLKLESYKRKLASVSLPERNASVYYDAISKKVVVLNISTGNEMYNSASLDGLKRFLDGGKKSSSKVSGKKANTKTANKNAKEKAKRIKEAKPKADPVPRYSELKPVEKIVIDRPGIIKLASQPVKLITLKDSETKSEVEGFMGVLNTKKKKVVSIVSDTYNLLPNKTVIDPILKFFDDNKIKYNFDRFTYVTDKNMRLHFTFPNIKIKDDSKEGIIGAMYVHNSYDNTESFNMTAGALRKVCINGMVAMVAFKKLKVIHQAHNIESIALANMEAIFNGFSSNTALIEARIKELNSQKATGALVKEIYKKFELRITAHMLREIGLLDPLQANADAKEVVDNISSNQKLTMNEWKIYNILTAYISHQTLQRYRLDYLRTVSKTFSL